MVLPGDATGNIVFEVGVKGLVLAVFDLQVCEVAPTVLCGEWTLLQIYVSVLLFLFWVHIISRHIHVVAVLVIHRAVGGVIRNFAHALRIYRHTLMRPLSHAEHLAHLRGRGGGAANASAYAPFVQDAILLTELLKVRVLEGCGS